MASSTINQPNKSDDQNNKLNQVSETFDENEKVLPISSANVEETINSESVKIIHKRATENINESSFGVIEKQTCALLAAPCISSTARARISVPLEAEKSLKLHARPFDEFLVQEPNTDVPPEKFVNPNDNKPSFIQKTS
ncbi:unnamed protein product [Rotaria socialis]|uniref:Uncharacterized protein n=1 Tax=Rotaria socialis TaxID=392032 RepID=A0A820VGG7_9BILA|nr:unnamed protein product [Rotaria socialis]CAF4473855.1 unnamed protein product [Rotaria socialis]CAF4486756.1 unnamed protein product [Rotaria socialis]CAF4499715.1 unnamed protein product [Rotaria socialis]CAF4678825.1 unnamed protein product [Rotaria socialis]